MLVQARAKLQAEIDGNKDNDFVNYIGQFLLTRLENNPEDAEKILDPGKTVQTCMSEMAAVAKEKAAMLTDREAFSIVLNHFGIDVVPPTIANDDLESDELQITRKFIWKNRLALVEQLAYECADNGGKFEVALRSVRLSEFAYCSSKMPVKQKSLLKKEVIKRSAMITYMRNAAAIGDTVRMPKLRENTLLGGYIRDGRKLVVGVIVNKELIASSWRYTVRRIEDGQIQKGNGHMIKEIVSRYGEVIQ
jgi:hypothetical protein